MAHSIPFSRPDLVERGYLPACKADEKTWVMPQHCLHEHFRFMPLRVQTFYSLETTIVDGKLVHPRAA